MKKTRVLSLLLILAMALSMTLSAAAYADGEKNDWKGIVWERDSLLDALFIRGVGVLPVEQPMPWQSDAARNVAVCFDDGVTEIPAGFTAGCVNMKTVMIPASVRSIGQGVLAVSGGLKDVFYQGTLQGLLSIQMFPEDRAALNGAVFHQSKINYDREDQPFDYVPIEHAEEGKMSIVDDGETVTGTLSDGTTYTITYNAEGQRETEVYHGDSYTYTTRYKYRPDGTLEWEETDFDDAEYGKGTMKIYYAEDGKTRVREDFKSNLGRYEKEYFQEGNIATKMTEYDTKNNLVGIKTTYIDGTATDSYYGITSSGYKTWITDELNANQKVITQTYEYPDYKDGVPDFEHPEKMVYKQVVHSDGYQPTSMDNYYTDGSTAHCEYKANGDNEITYYDKNGVKTSIAVYKPNGDYRITNYDKNGVRTSDFTAISGVQNYTQTYAEDGKTIKTIHVEWLSGDKAGDTRDYYYNDDGSRTQIDHFSNGSSLTRYFDKNGQETTETGSPIVP